jgi:hypothetical protein
MPNGTAAFLHRAEAVLPGSPDERVKAAACVALLAAAGGVLDRVPSVLEAVAINRERHLADVFLALCRNDPGSAPPRLPAVTTTLLTELSRHRPSALRACGGLAVLYPAATVQIGRLVARELSRPR